MTRTRLTLVTLALLGATLWSHDARATVPCQRFCECPTTIPGITPDLVFPIDLGMDLATNGRLLVSPPFAAGGFSLVDGTSAAVPFDVVPLDGSDAVWIVPRAALAPNTTYVLNNTFFAYEHMFRTTMASDTTAPTVATAAMPLSSRPPCDPLAVAFADMDITDAFVGPSIFGDAVLLEVSVMPTDGRAPLRYWTTAEVGTIRLAIGAPVGGGVCASDSPGSTSSFPGARVGDVVDVSITAIDGAGNRSTPLSLPLQTLAAVAAGDSQRSGACCGCRAGGAHGGTPTGLVGLALALWWLARRRRARG